MAEEEQKPMTVKERMKMFNKKTTFKVETSYDAIRRQRAEKVAAKKKSKRPRKWPPLVPAGWAVSWTPTFVN